MHIADPIEKTFRLSETQKKALKRLQLETVNDLIHHFPHRYGEIFDQFKIADLKPRMKATIYGTIKSIETGKTFRGRQPIARGIVEDETGILKVTWFSQPYIAKMFRTGDIVRLEGTISAQKSNDLYSMPNPQIEKAQRIPEFGSSSLFSEGGNFLHPIYPESRGITSNWFFHAIQKILKSEVLDEIQDPIPEEVLQKYNLPSLRTALIWIHSPKNNSDAISARKRFAFEEILYIQIQRQIQRKEVEELSSYRIEPKKEDLNKFISKFPFEFTNSQNSAVKNILNDIKTKGAMSRLLEGDVGSGKTAVAAAVVYATTNTIPPGREFGHLQTAYMVPTEILAKQHFQNFIQFFKGSGIQIGLITGSGCQKFPSKVNPAGATKISRSQLSKWVESGEIPIVIGTHALIQKSVKFKDLGLVIIDEQHRFGTEQRKKLAQKEGFAPHLLSMTATPIPRTLSLTIYGDLDLTILEGMPKGRKPVVTEIVPPDNREEVYEHMRKEIKNGRQAYVICPRIDEPDETKVGALYAKSVRAEAERLKKEVFPNLEIGKIHSKMKTSEKEDIMNSFESGKIDILVSTSVVEVGVNVPNATMILIEGAERFGLSQLHQLRGRVIRSNHQAYCFAFTESKNNTSVKRLNALKTAKNGFELSEMDLEIRGAGQLVGTKQWGISDVGMEAIKNIKMVEAAREEAKKIVEDDFEINKYPALKEKVQERNKIHLE